MPWEKPYKPPHNRRLDGQLYQQPGRICFITIRAYLNKSPFLNRLINEMIINILNEEQKRLHCIIYTYCLMPDHVHFMISPEEGYSVLEFANQYKGKTTNRSWDFGWKGKLWQPRFFDHIIRSDESLNKIAKYILNNPVRKELADSTADWEWSGQMNPFPM